MTEDVKPLLHTSGNPLLLWHGQMNGDKPRVWLEDGSGAPYAPAGRPAGTKGTVPTFPFYALTVGISFCVPYAWSHRMQNSAAKYKERHPEWCYITHAQPDKSRRIWCVDAAQPYPNLAQPVFDPNEIPELTEAQLVENAKTEDFSSLPDGWKWSDNVK